MQSCGNRTKVLRSDSTQSHRQMSQRIGLLRCLDQEPEPGSIGEIVIVKAGAGIQSEGRSKQEIGWLPGIDTVGWMWERLTIGVEAMRHRVVVEDSQGVPNRRDHGGIFRVPRLTCRTRS